MEDNSITKRLREIIDIETDGNVRKFSLKMGLNDSSKINRLFNVNKKNDSYPLPSTDVLMLIMEKYGYSIDWILTGKGNKYIDNGKVNNINIHKTSINGNRNITGNDRVDNVNLSDNSNEGLMDIVKTQQAQISELLKIMTKK